MRKFPILAAGLLAAVSASAANAAVFNYDFSVAYTGSAPASPTLPWITVSVADAGANTVHMTISNVNLTGSEFVTEFDFNVAKAITFNPTPIAKVGTFADPDVIVGGGSAGASIQFTNEIDFQNSPPADRFGAGESATFVITGTGLTANDFNVTTHWQGFDFFGAVHVQGIGTRAEDSGWLGGTPPGGGEIPEPATLGVLALGAVGLLARRRQKA